MFKGWLSRSKNGLLNTLIDYDQLNESKFYNPFILNAHHLKFCPKGLVSITCHFATKSVQECNYLVLAKLVIRLSNLRIPISSDTGRDIQRNCHRLDNTLVGLLSPRFSSPLEIGGGEMKEIIWGLGFWAMAD